MTLYVRGKATHSLTCSQSMHAFACVFYQQEHSLVKLCIMGLHLLQVSRAAIQAIARRRRTQAGRHVWLGWLRGRGERGIINRIKSSFSYKSNLNFMLLSHDNFDPLWIYDVQPLAKWILSKKQLALFPFWLVDHELAPLCVSIQSNRTRTLFKCDTCKYKLSLWSDSSILFWVRINSKHVSLPSEHNGSFVLGL